MAEFCPGTTKSSLEGIQAWYIRDETYSAALAELVNAQKKRPLAAFWGDRTTSSSEGQNFRVGSHGRYAGQVNLKYGQEPGVQIYTHISDQYSPFTPKSSAAYGTQHTYLMVCCTTKQIWKLQSITPTPQVSLSMFSR